MNDLVEDANAANLAYGDVQLGDNVRFGVSDRGDRVVVATSQGNWDGFSGYAAFNKADGTLTVAISGTNGPVDLLRDLTTVALFGGTGSRQGKVDGLVAQAVQNVKVSTGAGICGLTFDGHYLAGLDVLKAVTSGKYPGSVGRAFNSPGVGGFVGTVLGWIRAPGGPTNNIQFLDAESPGLSGIINGLGFRGDAVVTAIPGAAGHGIKYLRGAIYKSFYHNTGSMATIVDNINQHNSELNKLLVEFYIYGDMEGTGVTLGSGLIDHIQKMTMAAMTMADMKVWAHRS